MANFLSDLKSGPLGSKLIPDGDALKRKVDGQRETFLKGVSTTKHGKKEDPTYLHFRFIFDFGETSIMDPETFLAPSPLFRPTERTANDAEINSFARASGVAEQDLPNYIRALTENEAKSGNGNFYSDTDFFYGSKFKIRKITSEYFIASGFFKYTSTFFFSVYYLTSKIKFTNNNIYYI